MDTERSRPHHERLGAVITHMVDTRIWTQKPSVLPQAVFLSFVYSPSMATTSPEKFAQRATRYCDNLDGFVDRHDGSVVYGGHARVYEGTLRPKGIKVAVKTINLGVQNDAVIEVRSFSSYNRTNE